MGVTDLVKRGLVQAFVAFMLLAVILNIVAAAMSLKRDLWTIAGGYLLISVMLASALVVLWYSRHRQLPYRWRDENWGQERWREANRSEDAWSHGDEFDEEPWRDDPWRGDRD
jgi:hypothetical protein